MVSVNLFAGKEWRCSRPEQTCGQSRGRREGDRRRKAHRHVCAIVYVTESCGELLFKAGDPGGPL